VETALHSILLRTLRTQKELVLLSDGILAPNLLPQAGKSFPRFFPLRLQLPYLLISLMLGKSGREKKKHVIADQQLKFGEMRMLSRFNSYSHVCC
jgi:hypothetical protein